MQRLLSLKSASNLLNSTSTNKSSSLFHFQPHKTFFFTKPSPNQTQSHVLSSITTNPLHHQLKVHGFLSNPLLQKHLSLRLLNCRRGFLHTQFPKQSFNFKPRQNSLQDVRRSSWFQMVSSNGMVMGLIIANVVVCYMWNMADKGFMARNFTISVYQYQRGCAHAIITSAFSHIEIGHLVSGMLGLYIFGTNIGRVFGPGFLLILYLAGGISGSVFFLLHHTYLSELPENRSKSNLLKLSDVRQHPLILPSQGASGAVTATIVFDMLLHPTARLYFVIPIPAMLLAMFLLGQDYLRASSGAIYISGSSHLGGATVAAIVWVWARLRKRRCLV